MKISKLLAYSDGACKGNPGKGGCGVYIETARHKKVYEAYFYIGENCTNNEAEYKAFILAIRACIAMQVDNVVFYLDAELLVKQMNKIYRVQNKELIPLYEKAKDELNHIYNWKVLHIPRTGNTLADALANKAVATQLRKEQYFI